MRSRDKNECASSFSTPPPPLSLSLSFSSFTPVFFPFLPNHSPLFLGGREEKGRGEAQEEREREGGGVVEEGGGWEGEKIPSAGFFLKTQIITPLLSPSSPFPSRQGTNEIVPELQVVSYMHSKWKNWK